MSTDSADTLGAALALVLTERSGGVGSTVTVGHPEDPLLLAVGRDSPRVVPAPGAATRLLVAGGVAGAGTPAVVLVDAGVLVPWTAPVGVTAITRDAGAAEQLRGGGWTVVHPVWAGDIEPLLPEAGDGPLAMRLHDRSPSPADPPRPEMGSPRVLAEGERGVVVATGALVAAVHAALPALRAQGLDLALVDAHTRRPHAARTALVDPDHRMLVGGPQAAQALAAGQLRLGALRPIEVPADEDLVELLGTHVPLHG